MVVAALTTRAGKLRLIFCRGGAKDAILTVLEDLSPSNRAKPFAEIVDANTQKKKMGIQRKICNRNLHTCEESGRETVELRSETKWIKLRKVQDRCMRQLEKAGKEMVGLNFGLLNSL
nr:hypothetical protein Iba_chr09dCG6390 [Ipomoea batatas]